MTSHLGNRECGGEYFKTGYEFEQFHFDTGDLNARQRIAWIDEYPHDDRGTSMRFFFEVFLLRMTLDQQIVTGIADLLTCD